MVYGRQKQELVQQHFQWSAIFFFILKFNHLCIRILCEFRTNSWTTQAYGPAKFGDACLRGLRGDATVMECFCVTSQVMTVSILFL